MTKLGLVTSFFGIVPHTQWFSLVMPMDLLPQGIPSMSVNEPLPLVEEYLACFLLQLHLGFSAWVTFL